MKRIYTTIIFAVMLLFGTTAKSQCTDYATLPYATGFEGIASGSMPACWLQIQTGTSSSGTFPCVYEHAPNTRNGNCYFEFEASSSSSFMEVAALPMMQNISSLKLTMWVSSSSSLPCALEVGVLEADSTFTSVETLSLITFSGTSGWKQNYHEYTVFFDSYTGYGERIALRAVRIGTGQFTLFIDDLTVSEFNGCFPVSNLHMVDADSSEITVAWVDTMNYGATYTVTYWKDGGDTTIDSYVTDTFYTASGLDASSNYHFIVTPNCTGGDGDPISGSFRTTCGQLMIPFIESFESSAALECWSKVSCASSTGYNSGNGHTGSGSFRFYYNTNPPQYLITPPLGGTENDGILVSFWYKKYSTSYVENFKVGYSTTTADPSAFTWGNEVIPTTNYEEFTAVYPAGVKYVGIQYMQNNGFYLYIDDFSASIDNGCNKPNDAYIDSVGPYSADLRWTAGGSSATSYNLYYGTSSNIANATVINGISDTSYTLTGLLPQTTYHAWVRTECSGDSSDAKSFNSFTTQMTCAQLTGVTMGDISYTAAAVNWSYNNSVGFPSDVVVITLVDNTDSTVAPITVTTTGTTYVFTGLDAGHGYTVTLRNVCDAAGQYDTAATNTISFMTTSCSEISSDNTTNNYIPTYTYYNYSYAQAIYTHEQMPNVDTIRGVAFNVTNAPVSGNVRTWDVYMGHTSMGSFSGTSSWVPADSMTLVASNVSIDASTTGWKLVSFDSAFVYDGNSNIVIAVDDNTGSYKSGPSWASIAASNRGISVYSDGTNYNPASPTSGTLRSSIPAVRFVADCEVPTCFAPMITVDAVDSASISVHWSVEGIESSWAVGIRAAGDASYTYAPSAVTDTFYTFTGLNAATTYTIIVGSLCVDTLSTTITATTTCGVVTVPYFTDFEGLSTGNLPICWTATQTGSSGSGTFPSAYNYSSNARNGNIYFEFESNSGQTEVAVLPVMNNISSLMLSFWASVMNHNFVLEVGVMEGSTFVPVDTVSLIVGSGGNWHGSYNEYEIPLSSYTGTGNRIAMRVTASGSYTLMIDDLGVSVNTGCPRPDQPVVTGVTSDQVSISFSGSTTGDYMLYITDGVSYVDSASVAAATTYTFTGLSPVTTYTIDVHADCGSAISNPRTVTATTTMVPDSLPYSTGFEVGQDVSWMLVNGTQNNKWYIDSAVNNGGSRSLYISDNNGSANSYSGAASYVYATKLFSFDSIGDYAISYDWSDNGESTYDYLRVFLAPGSFEPDAGNASGIGTSGAPSGWIALDGGNKLNLSSNWQNHNEVFSIAAAGNYLLVFYWKNDGSVYNNPPAAIDNVQITRLNCPQPQNVVVDAVTDASATIHWTPAGSEGEWEVTCNGVTTYVSSASAVITGLDAAHSYTVEVRAVCGMGDTSFAASADFITDMCASAVTVENWDSTASSTTSSYAPVGYSFYNYGYVQTIIPAARMSANGSEITAMAFKPASSSAGTYFNHIDVYMANVSEDNLSSSFIHPDSAHQFAHVVVDADFSYSTTDWQLHAFDTSFIWDGSSNVLVAVRRGHGSYSSGSSFSAHNDTVARMRYVYTDGSAYDINTVSGGTASSAVGDLRLISCGGGCPAPVVASIVNDYANATVTVTGSGNGFELTYGTDPSNLGNPMTSTTGVFNLTGLTPATQYFVAIVQLCDSGATSSPTMRNFTTDSLPCFDPTDLTVVNTTFNSAELSWTSNGSATTWIISITGAGATRYDTVNTNPYTVTGLYADQQYSVMVMAVCGGGAAESGWSDAVTFTTDICTPVSNVTVDNITASSATVNWQAVAGSMGYKLFYGFPGFYDTEAQTAEVGASSTSYTITGLAAETAYEVYVLNRCTENLYSNVTANDRVGFTTIAGNGIYDVESGTLTLYPNPASTIVTLTVTGFDGEVEVEIVDMNGKRVSALRTQNSELQIDLGQVATGAYFVRVTGEHQTAVRKLIVK